MGYYEGNAEIPKAPPTVTYEDSLTFFLGDKEVRILFLGRAHTEGDSVIYLPNERVAFLSEIFFNKQFPGFRAGYPTEWVETLNRILELDADIFIPGHGLVEDGGRLRQTVVDMRDDLGERCEEVPADQLSMLEDSPGELFKGRRPRTNFGDDPAEAPGVMLDNLAGSTDRLQVELPAVE